MWSTLSDKWHEAPNTAEYYVRREVRSGSDSRALIIFTGPKTLNLNRPIYSQQRPRAALRLYGHRAARGACESSVLLGTGLQVLRVRVKEMPTSTTGFSTKSLLQLPPKQVKLGHSSACQHMPSLVAVGG